MSCIYIYHAIYSENTILEIIIRSYLIVNGICSYLYHRYLINLFGILDSGSMLTPVYLGSCYYTFYLPIHTWQKYILTTLLSSIHIISTTLDSFGSSIILMNNLIFYLAIIFIQLFYLDYHSSTQEAWNIASCLIGMIISAILQRIDLKYKNKFISRLYLHSWWHLLIALNVERLLLITDKIL